MKRNYYAFLLFLLICTNGNGQDNLGDRMEGYLEQLDSIDKKSITTKFLLNQGFMNTSELEVYFDFKAYKDDGFVLSDRKQFKRIYKGSRKSDIRKKKILPKVDFGSIAETYRDSEDRVPLGVLYLKGQYLDSLEIEENVRLHKNGVPNYKNYKKYHLLNASVLKKKVYSGTLTFDVLPELFNIVDGNAIRSIAVDFDDGKGFMPLKEGSYNVRYESTGEKAIAVRVELAKKSFVSYSIVNVVQLVREEPDMVIYPIAAPEGSDNGKKTGQNGQVRFQAARSAGSGGEAIVRLGCDRSFDRPVIVIEGFDPLNQNNVVDLQNNYTTSSVEQYLRANGFDMVYFNFADGGADIVQNAQVVRNLIEEVNRQKTGTSGTVVIGESMGGIVARLAIRYLEMAGTTHRISHFISFDSPHLGANIPVGFQTFLGHLDDIFVLNALNIAQGDIDEGLANLNAKAARQLLRRYKGPGPHPDFRDLQNELDRVGWPGQGGIRNLALVNGAVDGSLDDSGFFQENGGNIITVKNSLGTLLAPIGVNGVVRNGGLNSRTEVSKLEIFTFGIRTTNKSNTFTFDQLNYDIAAGGFSDIRDEIVDISGLNISIPEPLVGFVPLFSSTASMENLSSQNVLNTPAQTLLNRNRTPFDAIYGLNTNTEHIDAFPVRLEWDKILLNELGAELDFSCSGVVDTPPPAPRINGAYFFTCQNGRDRTLNVDNGTNIARFYTHDWSISGPRSFSLSNTEQITMQSNWPAGVYTVRCTRRYADGVVSSSPGTSTQSRTFSIRSANDRLCGGSGGTGSGGGNPGENSEDEDGNPRLVANLDDFNTQPQIVYPNPVNDILNVGYTMHESGQISITLYPINRTGPSTVLLNRYDGEEGEHLNSFDVASLGNGIYALELTINGKRKTFKIIIDHEN